MERFCQVEVLAHPGKPEGPQGMGWREGSWRSTAPLSAPPSFLAPAGAPVT